jgi:hypothetical protein
MPVSSQSQWAAIALCGAVAACSGGDIDRVLGRDDDDGDRNVAERAAVSACAEEVDEKDWIVLDTWGARPSGENDIEVSMRVRQEDGDVRDIDCIYDTGREDARLES